MILDIYVATSMPRRRVSLFPNRTWCKRTHQNFVGDGKMSLTLAQVRACPALVETLFPQREVEAAGGSKPRDTRRSDNRRYLADQFNAATFPKNTESDHTV